MKNNTNKNVLLSFLLSSFRGQALYRAFQRRSKKTKNTPIEITTTNNNITTTTTPITIGDDYQQLQRDDERHHISTPPPSVTTTMTPIKTTKPTATTTKQTTTTNKKTNSPQQKKGKNNKEEPSRRSPYVKKYYTIAAASRMEVPLNVTIPWAAKKQSATRVKNRGRYYDLIKTCPAAKELDSIIKKHVNSMSRKHSTKESLWGQFRSKVLLLIDFVKKYERIEDESTILSVKHLFFDSKTIDRCVRWWVINMGITSPATISNIFSGLRTFLTQFMKAETDKSDLVRLSLCNEDLKKEENRFYDLSNKVARENSRESVRRAKGKWLELSDYQTLTKLCSERGKEIVQKAWALKKRQELLSLEECKEYQQVLWILMINSTACQRPEVFFNLSDDNCTKEKDDHYQWKPFIEKNTFTTELRTLDWPSDLTPWIDFLLKVVRPTICEWNWCEIPTAFWLNTKGFPLAKGTGTKWFKQYLSQKIGKELTFRDYRWSQCALENAYPNSPEEHEKFLYLSDHTQNTVNVSYKVIRDVPREKGKHEVLSFHELIRGTASLSIDSPSSNNKKATDANEEKKKNKKQTKDDNCGGNDKKKKETPKKV
eukprot:TRINITY_DN377_c0_g1_i3.p1 TRINITY_DN377_c0_g1~~TRINITY_DN377_c0_g1_i3.p1  ORF type:complete len:598 (+),score=172.02 TRINITY_DN377_c0_g1_i3:369-2162(+)